MSLVKRLFKRVYASLPMKLTVFRALRKGFNLPESIYRHLHFEGVFKARAESGGAFLLQSYGDVLENELFWAGGAAWEQQSLRLWQRLTTKLNGSILDIGANTGLFALVAQTCRSDARVIAFEPVQRIAKRLKLNVELNHYPIKIETLAVSDETGSATFHDAPGDNVYSGSLEASQLGNSISYSIMTISLDDYLVGQTDRPVAVVKLDVEMHEPAALRGMIGMLRRDRPAILIEVLTHELGAAVAHEIDGLDYLVFGIDEDAGLVPIERPGPLHGRNWNNLLITRDRFEEAQLTDMMQQTPA